MPFLTYSASAGREIIQWPPWPTADPPVRRPLPGNARRIPPGPSAGSGMP